MTPVIQYALGTTLVGLTYLPALGISSNPLADYQPYAVADELGDLTLEGNGFPIVTWHWDFMPPGEVDILRTYLNGNLSTPIFVRTKLNALSTGAYTWQSFSGIMKWTKGPEGFQTKRAMPVDITFAGLVVAS